MATPIISEKELRIFAMDKPELNTLVDGVKFGPEEIEQAQLYVVDYYNMLPPPIDTVFSIEDFPSRALMLLGVWGHLLRGASIGETQNELEYSADGIAVNDRSHGQAFMNLGNTFWQEFLDIAKQIKITRNIARAFGSVGSEYRRRAFY